MVVRLVVGVARILATRPPAQIRRVLNVLRRGAEPATARQAAAARADVVAVSLGCAAPEGCLPRSLATVMLCRLQGRWPTWCVGVRRMAPFGAHSWVEAEGGPVGEDAPAGYFATLISVP